MFRALLAHPQAVLCTNDTLYIVCVLCQLAAPGLEWNSTGTDIIRTQYTKWAPPEDEQVMLGTCRDP
jgi:hypothetical protein